MTIAFKAPAMNTRNCLISCRNLVNIFSGSWLTRSFELVGVSINVTPIRFASTIFIEACHFTKSNGATCVKRLTGLPCLVVPLLM